MKKIKEARNSIILYRYYCTIVYRRARGVDEINSERKISFVVGLETSSLRGGATDDKYVGKNKPGSEEKEEEKEWKRKENL